MPTYYPQDGADAVMTALVVLAALIGLASWLAGLYDLRHPLPATPADDPDFQEVPSKRRFTVDTEANARELHNFGAAADLARGTSENFPVASMQEYHGSNGMYWDDHAGEWVVEP